MIDIVKLSSFGLPLQDGSGVVSDHHPSLSVGREFF